MSRARGKPPAALPALRVAIDMTFPDRNRGGSGTYARSLVDALQRRDDVSISLIAGPAAGGPLRTIEWLARGARLELHRGLPDIVHCPAFVAAWRCPAPYVLTIHDASARQFSGDHPLEWRLYDRLFLPGRARRARLVLTGSRTAAAEICRHYGIPLDRIRVTAYGIDPVFHGYRRPDGEGAPETAPPVLLFPGAPVARKNLDSVLAAMAAAERHTRVGHAILRITGARAEDFPGTRARIAALGLGSRVEWLGSVPFTELPRLYSEAQAIAYPSINEGFGFPPLEAMAVGTPVVASTGGCLPEVLGDAALLVAPRDVAGLMAALEAVLTRPGVRSRLVERGRRRAAQFTWDRCAEATVSAYRAAMAS